MNRIVSMLSEFVFNKPVKYSGSAYMHDKNAVATTTAIMMRCDWKQIDEIPN